VSLFALRTPTVAQTWQRVQRDHETGIPGWGMILTKAPAREALETWAIQIGQDPKHYLTAWVRLGESAAHQKESKAAGEEKSGERPMRREET
jgi:L-alanine-DL-glutamate epimerase-like enolase superfamily enzyme